MERDTAVITVATLKFDISTHTLTWSVTRAAEIAFATLSISTHTLTWSVTRQQAVLFS